MALYGAKQGQTGTEWEYLPIHLGGVMRALYAHQESCERGLD